MRKVASLSGRSGAGSGADGPDSTDAISTVLSYFSVLRWNGTIYPEIWPQLLLSTVLATIVAIFSDQVQASLGLAQESYSASAALGMQVAFFSQIPILDIRLCGVFAVDAYASTTELSNCWAHCSSALRSGFLWPMQGAFSPCCSYSATMLVMQGIMRRDMRFLKSARGFAR